MSAPRWRAVAGGGSGGMGTHGHGQSTAQSSHPVHGQSISKKCRKLVPKKFLQPAVQSISSHFTGCVTATGVGLCPPKGGEMGPVNVQSRDGPGGPCWHPSQSPVPLTVSVKTSVSVDRVPRKQLRIDWPGAWPGQTKPDRGATALMFNAPSPPLCRASHPRASEAFRINDWRR